MRAKRYLNQVRMLDKKIEHRREEIERLKDEAKSVSSTITESGRVQTSPDADQKTKIVDRYVDMEREVEGKVLDLNEKRDEIIGTIHQLKDRRFVELLYLKYVKYMRLEEIACRMKKSNGQEYSYAHIADLHGKALRAIEEIINIDS